jgi:TRAP-type C4-dicarboxylate transport system permease small subunit
MQKIITKLSDFFNRSLQMITVSLIISLVLIVVFAVIFRKVGYSLQWYDELASVFLAWLTFYGAALTVFNRGHLGVDSFVKILPKKPKMIVFCCSEILIILFFVILALGGFRLIPIIEGEYLVSLSWFPVWLSQSVVIIGSMLFIIAEILTIPLAWKKIN